MLYCRFFKVNQDTNWDTLSKCSRIHEQNMRKTLPYKILDTLVVPQSEFNNICDKIYLSHLAYKELASKSVAGLDGIWSCIVLCGDKDSRKLIIYTAGQIYPLYAGIKED